MRITILLVIGLMLIVQEKEKLALKADGHKVQTVAGYKAPVKIGKRG